MTNLACVSTDQVVCSDRLMKWKEFMSDHLGCTPDYIKRLESTFIDPLHHSNFQGRLEYGDLGPIRFCRMTASAHRYSRQLSKAVDALDTPRMLILQTAGVSHFTQGQQDSVLAPDEMLLVDCGKPFSVTSTQGCEHFILLFHGTPAHSAAEPADMHLSGRNGLGRILMHMISDAYNQYPLLNGNSGRLLGESIVGVLDNALQNKNEEKQLTHDFRLFKQNRLKAYIERHLAERDLTIERIANAEQCSVRSLHRAFQADQGCTVSEYIWQRRLSRCAEDLRNGELAQRSLTDIAYAWGYGSSSHFSRHFKSTFGMSPRLFREMARGGDVALNAA
ncbi:helix-turn-helix domain-containing protein [Pseudomonas syringae]|uniref:Helix-turn-helix domain-containing protein n=3 Tax=Pseudomonas syringae group TaxID=136849 RepID=A0A9Q4A2N6_PSESX|nr:helix-turn-helix domain-containing protein [Pseudomonas syringae]KTB59741.1 AraC family transcriptional regulator [Pseudomonas viridiflava ICMP 13104]KTB81555.1 AraC family transcriptional regulator [Pseudomonas syringae pv. syringae PD2766]MCF5466481.1 helix-turn-helix domain-containing protein [Pseudomonas syringae]MCF5471426.1 helix-turn-helix domain-containing protein [Pseudomonas syringae]MCF5482279.1 helix-turn-helix domain-containing protein [Pseudomonas syringae]